MRCVSLQHLVGPGRIETLAVAAAGGIDTDGEPGRRGKLREMLFHRDRVRHLTPEIINQDDHRLVQEEATGQPARLVPFLRPTVEPRPCRQADRVLCPRTDTASSSDNLIETKCISISGQNSAGQSRGVDNRFASRPACMESNGTNRGRRCRGRPAPPCISALGSKRDRCLRMSAPNVCTAAAQRQNWSPLR